MRRAGGLALGAFTQVAGSAAATPAALIDHAVCTSHNNSHAAARSLPTPHRPLQRCLTRARVAPDQSTLATVRVGVHAPTNHPILPPLRLRLQSDPPCDHLRSLGIACDFFPPPPLLLHLEPAMGPSSNAMAAQLRQMILYHFDNNFYDNALFLAGRLNSIDPRNSDSIHLLALCHLRLGQYKAAYDYCRLTALRGAHLGCAYVFAQACLALEKHTEGVAALEKSRVLWSGKTQLGGGRHEDASKRFLPDAAAVFCLLGKLLWANNDPKRAVECYVEALKLNPFMWDAFERLCETNTPIRASAIFKPNPELLAFLSTGRPGDEFPLAVAQPVQSYKTSNWYTPSNDPFNGKIATDSSSGLGSSNITSKLNIGASSIPSAPMFSLSVETPPSQHEFDGPLGPPAASSTHQVFAMEPPNAPVRRHRPEPSVNGEMAKLRFGDRARLKTSSSDVNDVAEPRKTSSQIAHPKRTISGHSTQSSASGGISDPTAAPQRRSVRLFKKDRETSVPAAAPPAPMKDLREIRKVRATGTRGRTATTSTVGRVVSGNRKQLDPGEGALKEPRLQSLDMDAVSAPQRPLPNDGSQDRDALKELLELMSKLAGGYHALCRYQMPLALQCFQSVPTQHRDSPWVLAQIGKAQYEQNNYLEAERTFARLRKMCPSRMQDMEVYSTVLWHLKNDTELAFLSHELVETERLSPQAWCTIGNSFSLSRDHDQALKCFKRSTQLDPKFAYGFTLQGHEHVENEEYEKALLSYRKAIAVDRRHYNGWYGLGKVYEKLGKYDMAESHYRRAAEINPNNSIIRVCIGAVLEKQKKPLLALQQYEKACELAPTSAISKFKKARVLLSMRRIREALAEFLDLKDMVPDESSLHFMLGRTYKVLHDKSNAIRHFTIALNLDPKASQYIKEAMEDLDDDDDQMDDDD
ncbi:hypothetical protein FH972_025427 [Carpinus fangiana]|uniref:Cdc23 domain-containing protein n=1 Tax=Carpinus fangiana TaxID=176857 RepID=A0A5N6L1L2_9ROSI|nr:hypothetical protein FH972_025427 [Carpinus fangiana]